MNVNHKHAALRLHGMADEDRNWCLQRLPDAQRAMVEPLLAELIELGIPGDLASSFGSHEASANGSGFVASPGDSSHDAEFDPAIDADPPSSVGGPQPAERGTAQPGHLEALAAASADSIWPLLSHEPVAVVAAICGAHPWPWRQALLARFPTALRRQISSAMDSASSEPPKRVVAALLEGIRQQLELASRNQLPAVVKWPGNLALERIANLGAQRWRR